jgi:L-rhamnose-H+ transport protein
MKEHHYLKIICFQPLQEQRSSWILHMAFIILVANSWGLVLHEWKGVSKKTMTTIVAGILTIILSVLIVGYGNSLKA